MVIPDWYDLVETYLDSEISEQPQVNILTQFGDLLERLFKKIKSIK